MRSLLDMFHRIAVRPSVPPFGQVELGTLRSYNTITTMGLNGVRSVGAYSNLRAVAISFTTGNNQDTNPRVGCPGRFLKTSLGMDF